MNFFKDVREMLTPVLKESAFLDHGMLTPEEFVIAGDHLIRTCPTWKWQSGDASKLKAYLPKDKQFLTTTGIPCYRRASALSLSTSVENTVASGDGGEDWCAPELIPVSKADDDAVLVTDDDLDLPAKEAPIKEENSVEDQKVVSPSDVDDMVDDSVAYDDNNVVISDGQSEVLQCRRYDVSITYDNYYRTPRIWLFGYDENGSPLTTNQIYEDVMQDYANKTVTVDPHPHLGHQHASIHPCKHSSVMLQIVQDLKAHNRTPMVEQYLFIFLKFIQSVVPTIEYDFTVDVDLGVEG